MTAAHKPAYTHNGPQDVAGWGFLGLTIGTVAGFIIAFYVVIPLFPRDASILMLTLMTGIAVASMTISGGVGYLLTRKKSSA